MLEPGDVLVDGMVDGAVRHGEMSTKMNTAMTCLVIVLKQTRPYTMSRLKSCELDFVALQAVEEDTVVVHGRYFSCTDGIPLTGL